MILLSDRRVSAIPVSDNGEALVDVRQVAELRVDDRLADAAGAYAHLREATVQRLLAAQRTLPRGLRLLIIEGYRPLSLQTTYFESYKDELRHRYPEWDSARRHVEANKYISPPGHGTGRWICREAPVEDRPPPPKITITRLSAGGAIRSAGES
ncbi:hypothetical protein [Micromonospora thermarum]|uniref:hypothetical protein n=1 Tax=Micromonospora thermarum TaxID=2720024 RepID=UPI00197C9586|nr:hypothetical protein [Micromonospora thermarum]